MARDLGALRPTGVSDDRIPPASTGDSPAISPTAQLTPELVLRLQRGAGNTSVQRLVRERVRPAPLQVARLRTSGQFVKRSDLFGRERSQALQDIDTALASYDAVRGGTAEERENALFDLFTKIGAWKTSKATATDDKAWKKSARATYIKELADEQDAEMQLVRALKAQEEQDRQAAALKRKQDAMDAMITPTIAAITDSGAKAKALFAAYMKKFRGKATYSTTTPAKTTVWDMKDRVACAMISNGLIDLLRHAGLTATLREVGPQNFVTKKLGASFIDPKTEGNVRLPGGTFKAEKRFFFNKHWIVDVGNGALYLDPTSGIEVDKDATEIIAYKDMVRESPAPPVFSNGTWRVSHIGNNAIGDGAYELTEV